MPTPEKVYVKCDELEHIPKQNKKNWLFENKLLAKYLPKGAKVLQVGCMDATRMISLLKTRPDLHITGLEIDGNILKIAKSNLKSTGKDAQLIRGDITKPLDIGRFDYVVCLNNTLGYIKNEKKAIENMKKLGKNVVVSVYGEKFNDSLGIRYFKSIGLKIKRIGGNVFHAEGFVDIKRYTKKEIGKWGGNVIETPIGYFCMNSS